MVATVRISTEKRTKRKVIVGIKSKKSYGLLPRERRRREISTSKLEIYSTMTHRLLPKKVEDTKRAGKTISRQPVVPRAKGSFAS